MRLAGREISRRRNIETKRKRNEEHREIRRCLKPEVRPSPVSQTETAGK